ncbi:hypothetical protein C0992_005864 [Termitomyces sp. T32_za158]|nr:hypothetical protein C0992_005864 [Termitomyces sp. T32_za158]
MQILRCVKTFNKVVGTQDRIVLVDFYAECVTYTFTSEAELLTSAVILVDSSIKSGSGLPIDVVKIDTENEQVLPLAQQYKVRALPTVIAFRNGEVVGNFVGMLGEDGVKRLLQTV